MKNTTTILGLIIISIATITLNGFYFEYCISRDLPSFLSVILSIVVIGLDILALNYVVKSIKKLLNL